jgi:TetR/AcrR family transcriptional regulator
VSGILIALTSQYALTYIGKVTGRAIAHSRLTAEKRREQLIEVAVELFSRKGFKGTTTREIAAAAGVTEAIIFRHFETKEQLYTAIIDQKVSSAGRASWLAAVRRAMKNDDDEAVIRQLVGAIIQMHKDNSQFERFMAYAALEGNETALLHMRQVTASIVDEFRSYFQRRQEQGQLCPVGPDAALMAIAGMAQNYALGKYVHGHKDFCISDAQALESFTRIAMYGLAIGQVRPGHLKKTGAKR